MKSVKHEEREPGATDPTNPFRLPSHGSNYDPTGNDEDDIRPGRFVAMNGSPPEPGRQGNSYGEDVYQMEPLPEQGATAHHRILVQSPTN